MWRGHGHVTGRGCLIKWPFPNLLLKLSIFHSVPMAKRLVMEVDIWLWFFDYTSRPMSGGDNAEHRTIHLEHHQTSSIWDWPAASCGPAPGSAACSPARTRTCWRGRAPSRGCPCPTSSAESRSRRSPGAAPAAGAGRPATRGRGTRSAGSGTARTGAGAARRYTPGHRSDPAGKTV